MWLRTTTNPTIRQSMCSAACATGMHVCSSVARTASVHFLCIQVFISCIPCIPVLVMSWNELYINKLLYVCTTPTETYKVTHAHTFTCTCTCTHALPPPPTHPHPHLEMMRKYIQQVLQLYMQVFDFLSGGGVGGGTLGFLLPTEFLKINA